MPQEIQNHRRPLQEQDPHQTPSRESCARHGGGGLAGLLEGHRDANVGDLERVLSVMGGGILTVFGAARGGLAGLGLAVLGGGLLYRGVTGHCEAYHSLGIDTSDHFAVSSDPDPSHVHP